jgi:hypothetical protein
MSEHNSWGDGNYGRKQIFWGVLLIGVGATFLCDRMGWLDLDIRMLWVWWPLMFAVSSLWDAVSARTVNGVLHALTHLAMWLWVYANLSHLWGWTFGTTWPIAMILGGLTMMLRGKEEQQHGDKQQESTK